MTTEHVNEIRRRKDGSIDTAYYMAKGRNARSAQAHNISISLGQRLIQLFKIRLPQQKASKSVAHCH